ncbi:galactokinase family protein [Corynebacterium aquilae]|uniref:galactokinase family protein n=1 Tax=Corynebacterium aquilae TaxID=203263 RepID=UPI000952BC1B|nr:galactokinase family protein [Corynebacterium aquilae]
MPASTHRTLADVQQAARAAHREHFSSTPSMWAAAPASWFAIGEHTDAAGGVVVCGLTECGVAVAVTPRSDQVVNVVYVDASGAETVSQASLAEEQPFGVAAPTYAGEAALDCARRIAGLVSTATGRQLIARQIRGADVTVVCDIPAGVGLGERASVECAVLLAMAMSTKDRDEAPIRARLVEVAVSAAASYSPEPPVRARYTAIMRGAPGSLQVIDYHDGSLTHTPHLVDAGCVPFLLALPDAASSQVDVAELRQRVSFVQDASKAFGVESLRHLPDASPRVTAWLAAMHGAQRGNGLPSADKANAWLDFFEVETTYATDFVSSIRSRRHNAAVTNIDRSREATAGALGLASQVSSLAELARQWGADAARPAAAGLCSAVIGYAPASTVEDLSQRAQEHNLRFIVLSPGSTVAG